MIYPRLPVISVESVGTEIFVLTLQAPHLGALVRPGQFINIKVTDTPYPLLRRPFSVYRVEEERVSVIFNVVGIGTGILAAKRAGDFVDVIGPLGSPFPVEGEYTTAILVGGGLGVAPLPLLTDSLTGRKKIQTFVGGRSADHVVTDYLQNLHVATDDGSTGHKGTVVDLLREHMGDFRISESRIFACGPTPMLRSLQSITASTGIKAYFSLESAMACGIGICQGCPAKRTGTSSTYSLICKEGPVFDSSTLIME
jgi:dihydroorotate dehydrogenase electron transfer subunit